MPIKNRKAQASRPVNQVTISGKVSQFGGPNDPTDSGHTANGMTTATPGIAVYNHATLGGYWKVRFANGREVVLRQTDIGPAPWTGRVLDVTYSAVALAGYTEQNFPTDSHVDAVYLGTDKQTASLAGGGNPVAGVAANASFNPLDPFQISPIPLPNPLDILPSVGDVGSVVSVISDLLTGNIGDLAGKLAITMVKATKDMAVGFVDLVVAPTWHWNQRTVNYYATHVLDPRGIGDTTNEFQWAFAWTAAFWGMGYVILFTDGDSPGLKPAPVKKARLARHVRRAQALPARRSLVKPKDTTAHTPKKPVPVPSKTVVKQVGTMTTTRPRPVKVNATTHEPQSVTSETPIVKAGDARGSEAHSPSKQSQSDAQHSGRQGTHEDSGDHSPDASAQGPRPGGKS